MAGFKDNALERRNASIAAKQALLEKFKSQPTLHDPLLQQRLAERRAIAEARAVRMAERKRLQEIEKLRQAEIKAAEEAARRAAEEERQRQLAEQALLEERKREERKVARDARYAARKQRVMRKIR